MMNTKTVCFLRRRKMMAASHSSRRTKTGVAGVVLAACLGATSVAQAAKPTGLPGNYPNKAVRVIVGSAAGGGADGLARLITAKMSDAWGTQFYVDNIATGVGGILAIQTTYKSAPDGYTIQNTSGSTFQNATFQYKLEFDLRKVFAPVAQLTISPQFMSIYPKAPFQNLKELVAYAKANPEKISYGSSGLGSGAHLVAEYISYLAGFKMTHIPYKGAGQSTLDAIAGRIQVVFTSPTAATPHINRGTLKGLGITAANRMKSQPDVPTLAEQGIPGLSGLDYVSWIGWVTRTGTPKPIVDALNKAVNEILSDPAVSKAIIADGGSPVTYTPEQFGRNINNALNQVEEIVAKTGIKLSQ